MGPLSRPNHRQLSYHLARRFSGRRVDPVYHGWTYHLDGRVKAVPLNHGYPQGFDPKDPKMAMLPVPRVKSYRGFVFASEASDGGSLEEWLGHMTTSLDDMIDRAPDGEIEVAGGVFKHAYDGNWKVYFENLCDAAHPLF